jgi:hypothetical protein
MGRAETDATAAPEWELSEAGRSLGLARQVALPKGGDVPQSDDAGDGGSHVHNCSSGLGGPMLSKSMRAAESHAPRRSDAGEHAAVDVDHVAVDEAAGIGS